ncbi:hypothetical protein CRG98_043445 [Punica granatum]|uniref:Uncharacterized protein n=1 Tax=Punica granatum TaxID=22663 RepID=A0A2I0HY05_PUNGR|nr:hypothetical protein CRG98_043445 [Punica granatum]
METSFDTVPQFLATFLSALAVLACITLLCKSHKSRRPCNTRPLPQPEGCWPIIGHLHLFHKQQLTHKTLSNMADKYGPIFTVKLGSHRALVVSSWEVARECFTVHDKVFSTRPIIAATRLMGYNCAMFGFAPYGPYWREMRRIVMVELLSNAQLDKMRHMKASEVDNVIKELYEHSSVRGSSPVDMKRWFGDLNLNFSLRLVGGKQYRNSEEKDPEYCRRLARDFFNMFGVFVLSDAIPMLGWWDMNGYKKLMKETAEGMDALVGGWLEEHKRRRLLRKEGKELEDDDEKDFMAVLIDNLDGAGMSGFDADTVIKSTCALRQSDLNEPSCGLNNAERTVM